MDGEIMENKTVEIWIRGRKLTELKENENQEVIENFEQIVRKAGYTVEQKEEDGRIIKMV
jgi:hypothetical protein